MITGDPTVEEQPCGCKTTSYPIVSRGSYTGPNPVVEYNPCLPCALANAGNMLQQAAERMREALAAEAKAAADAVEAAKALSEGFIGGSD